MVVLHKFESFIFWHFYLGLEILDLLKSYPHILVPFRILYYSRILNIHSLS